MLLDMCGFFLMGRDMERARGGASVICSHMVSTEDWCQGSGCGTEARGVVGKVVTMIFRVLT